MLFNTLGYAQFLALVFVVSWALVDRRTAVFLPALPLVGLSLHGVVATGASVVLVAPLLFALGLSALFFWFAARRAAAPTIDSSAPTTDPSAPTTDPSAPTTDSSAPFLSLAEGSALVLLQTALLGFVTVRLFGLDPGSYLLGLIGVPIQKLVFGVTTIALVVIGVALVRARKVRLLFLLGASYVFYAHWDYRFLPLIWASSTADYFLARAIASSRDDRRRKLWLVFTVVMNLGVLGFFKYFDFGVDSMAALLRELGVAVHPVALRIALPVGISFFTFESMSYVIDVYRRELEPQKSYSEYLAFVAFFPHLVAGPIVRPRDLLPQLTERARFSASEASEGLFLIAVGLGKKILIGDYLALNLVDRVFDAPAQYSALEVYAAVIGYALQIYSDFSGYTDIAIGSALLLGVRFPKNFDSPYQARDIVDFWRRWHISLSTWLRDYLYIPLGGNRKGRVRTYVNLFLTMVLGGLWHGASFTFVVWGALHGLALGVNKAWSEWRAGRRATRVSSATGITLGHVIGVFVTFHFVCFAWIFFRADSFAAARLVLARLGSGSVHHANLHPPVLAALAVGLVFHYVPRDWFARLRTGFTESPAWAQGLLLFCAALLLRRLGSTDAVPFVYFQF